jgi:hypothetical protein
MSKLRDAAIAAAQKAIYRVSMFDPGERSPQIDKLIARDARVTTEAVVEEIVAELRGFAERGEDHGYKKRDTADWLEREFKT